MIMKRLDILAAFEVEIDKIDDALNKPVTDDSLYWLNQAVNKFMKERFNGNAPHYTSYEQNEKRTKDLHRLFKKVHINEITIGDEEDNMPTISMSTNTENLTDKQKEKILYFSPFAYYPRNQFASQMYMWPSDLLYILNEDVSICSQDGEHYYDTSIFECTADNFMYRVTNSLTDFHYKYHKARPLRVRCGENESGVQFIVLLNDKKYYVEDYYISYLRRPEKLTNEDPDNADVEYNDFEDSVWFEIIKIAAQMYVENKAEPRYRTLTNEVLTQE